MTFAAGPNWSHGSGQSWVTAWTPDKVVAAPDPVIGVANYIEYLLGVGFPTKKDLILLRKRINEIFSHYPKANYYTICRIVMFNKRSKRKFARVYTVMDSFRDAMVAGELPELVSHHDESLAVRIGRFLGIETDRRWRSRLLACPDDDARRHVLDEWEQRSA